MRSKQRELFAALSFSHSGLHGVEQGFKVGKRPREPRSFRNPGRVFEDPSDGLNETDLIQGIQGFDSHYWPSMKCKTKKIVNV